MSRGKWWLLGAVCGVALALAGSSAGGPRSRGAEPSAQEALELRPRVTSEMVRYSRTRYALYFIGTFCQIAVLFAMFGSGLSARLRDMASRRYRSRYGRTLAYFLLFTAVYGLAMLPLSFYSGWLLEHRYRLSHQSLAQWAWDGVKDYLVGSVLLPPVIVLLTLCLTRSPRRWWLGFWLASIPISVFLMLIAPVAIDPLFNRFEPLRDPVLRDKILALARRAGVEGGRVFQVDMSTKTAKMNAYVYGLGATKRIVLWDTMLTGLDADEVLSVVAHEIGHYVLHHVFYGLALSIGGTLILLLAVDRSSHLFLRLCGKRSGVRDLADLASLPLLLGVAAALGFLGSPVANAVSRGMERQADDFELRLTRSGRTAARAFVRLSEQNLSLPDPPPFIEFWLFSHPPLSERIEHALAFDRQKPTTDGD